MSDYGTQYFCVVFFGDPPNFRSKPTKLFRQITVTNNFEDHITVRQVKQAAGEAIKLKALSLDIFGLFLGCDIGLPRMLCPDQAVVPKSITQFSFQLVSFNPEVESKVICQDDKAMELIYWELKNLWGYYGFPFKAQTECNMGLFSMYRNITQRTPLSASNIRHFLHNVRIHSSYFRSCYYNARCLEVKVPFIEEEDASAETEEQKKLTVLSYCCTKDLFMVEKSASSLTRQDRHRPKLSEANLSPSIFGALINVLVIVNMEKLTICDTQGHCELLSLNWSLIKSLKIENKPVKLFIIEFLISSGPDGSRKITIQTDCNEFLYSVSKHIISLKDWRRSVSDSAVPLNLSSKSEGFINPIFNNSTVDHKKLVNVVTGILNKLSTASNEKVCEPKSETKSNYDTDSTGTIIGQSAVTYPHPSSVARSVSTGWSAGHTDSSPNEGDSKHGNSRPTRISIMQMPLSMLLPPNELTELEKNRKSEKEEEKTMAIFLSQKSVGSEEVPNIQVNDDFLNAVHLKEGELIQRESFESENASDSGMTLSDEPDKHNIRKPNRKKTTASALKSITTAFSPTSSPKTLRKMRGHPLLSPKARSKSFNPLMTRDSLYLTYEENQATSSMRTARDGKLVKSRPVTADLKTNSADASPKAEDTSLGL